MSVEDAMEALHGGSLKSFVARRKELAKELRSAGDKQGARDLTAVAKPPLAAWVINRLVRGHQATVAAAVSAIDRQRDLQLGALSGQLDMEALDAARLAERVSMKSVAEHAALVLEDDGHAASKTNLERVARMLRSAALDPDARPLLDTGRLGRDVGEGGFDAVASQLDPSLLLAALTAKPKPVARRSNVDGMFARSTRGDGQRPAGEPPQTPAPVTTASTPAASVEAPAEPPESEPPESEPTEQTVDASKRRGETELAADVDHARDDAAEVENVKRLATAKIAAARARTQIAEHQVIVAACEQRLVELEMELTTVQVEARSARRKLGDYKVKLERAEKRIRLLED